MNRIIVRLSIILLLISCGGQKNQQSNLEQTISDQKSLAIASLYRRNFQQALRDVEKIESLDSNDPELYVIKGLVYFGLRDFNMAEASYERALEIKPDY